MGCSVAAQAVGDQATRLVLEASQQPLEEALGGFAIAAALDQDVEHHAMLVDCAPEIMQRAIDADEDLVQVPDVTWLRPAFAQPLRRLRPEFPHQLRMFSLVTITPRSARISSTSRRLRLKR